MYYLTSYELQVKVLHPTQHNVRHFGDVPKTISNKTTKACIHQSKEIYNTK